jgi:hypothetical protein
VVSLFPISAEAVGVGGEVETGSVVCSVIEVLPQAVAMIARSRSGGSVLNLIYSILWLCLHALIYADFACNGCVALYPKD